MRARLGPALVVLILVVGCACARRAPAPPNLVLITVDTLRADHLGFAGYARDTSPHLDALAGEGVWFPRCYAASATTGASHASLFTSLPPPVHGVLANRQRFPRLPTLMSALKERGYTTAGFVSSVVLGRKSGLQDHFDHFDDQLGTPELNRKERYERPGQATVAAALAHLTAQPAGRPFLLWIHLIDPHGPYRAPVEPDRFQGDALARAPSPVLPLGQSDWVRGQIPAYQALEGRRDAAFYVARYDAEIRYADQALGELFAGLRRAGLYERSLIAVTADHGETLVEPGHKRCFSHGTVAYEETVRVPLVIREPGGGRRLQASREGLVTSLDLAPTLLALLGHPSPPGFEGRNLLEEAALPEGNVFSLGAYGSSTLEREIGTQHSLLRGPWRYVRNSQDGSEELFDHRLDPQELRDLAGAQPQVVATLRQELDRFLARGRAQAPPVEMTPEHLEALKALGYAR
ncbi:MAG TPA: sulfatase [Vicinamibacteria bacterium]|nr:sulfatase [Vicinamibacteria bacterium]